MREEPTKNRERQECVDCGAHTYWFACTTCGSMKLQRVGLTTGDLAGARLTPATRRFQREALATFAPRN